MSLTGEQPSTKPDDFSEWEQEMGTNATRLWMAVDGLRKKLNHELPYQYLVPEPWHPEYKEYVDPNASVFLD